MPHGKFSSWSRRSPNRSIFFAALTITAITALVKAASALKEILIAHQFGVGNDLDAYLIAFLIPSLFINVIAVSLSTVAVPAFIHVKVHEGEEAAQQFISSALLICVGVLAAVSILLFILGPFLLPALGSNFSPDKLMLTRHLYYLLVPILLFNGLACFLGGILNASERFGVVSWVQILVPVITIIILLACHSTLGIYALALGTVLGFLLEALMLVILVAKHGYSLYPKWGGWSSALLKVRSEYLPLTAGALLISGMTAVDQAMAASLSPGSVAALGYGGRLVAMLVSLMTGLSAAVLTYFSKMSAEADWHGIRHSLRTYSRLIFILGVPGVLVLIYYSRPITSLFFEHGAFTGRDTTLVSDIQIYYFLQIPFYMASLLVMRLIVSLKANNWVLWISLLGFSLNAFLNYVLMSAIGVAGIALSTSIVYMVTFVCFWLVADRLLNAVEVEKAQQNRISTTIE